MQSGDSTMKRIAVIGSLNVDYVANVMYMPKIGETVLSGGFKILPGGKGANQAYAIGRMGAPVAMFGAVGNDANALFELQNLQSANVDVTHICTVNEPTGIAMIAVDENGDNCIVVSQGANRSVTKEYIDEKLDALQKFDIFIFQLEIPLETVVYAAQKLKAMGKTIILDPAPAPGRLPEELLNQVDFVKPNETELAILTGILDAEQACGVLLDQGVSCVLASLGPAGVMVQEKGKPAVRYEVERVKAVDTTAAGDSFTAAFAFALANASGIEQAVQFANKVATVVVQRPGAQQSIPASEEIQAIWNETFQ